ncbi:hypothetical protein [Herbiconiux ginsengi]|uniref:DUF1508 domain-containing protein n=1 Tax=Herbiconiux ginsengi TaxID=381665 RepID=A0A1H3S6X7_9MICO|nr:hypothetical protein [Herbiconiux ginsengi]SDZ33480.1 hypothetical protein SAMN05216554_3345 [Herbiconiux ginsengi]
MSETSRVVFSSFRAGGDPMLDSWNRFRQVVAPVSSAGSPERAGSRPGVASTIASGAAERTGIWRILATNNRELCRSAHVYPSFSSARAHVLQLRDRIDELVVTPVIGPRPGSRGWYMTLNGVVVVTCGRWYGAAASSAEAASASLEELARAAISEAARDVTAPGRRAPGRPAPRTATDRPAW